MNYPIPTNAEEIIALRHQPIDDEVVAAAVAGVVWVARSEGRSLEDLKAEVMADDRLLDFVLRQRLSDLVAVAWTRLPDEAT
jgi:hypothetical protein